MTFDLNYIMNDLEDIPSLPEIFYPLVNVKSGAGLDWNAIAKIASKDESLTTAILKFADGPVNGLDNKAGPHPESLSATDAERWSKVALATSIITLFPGIPENLVTLESFWAHSLASGLAAQEIGKLKMEDAKHDLLYIAGMIQEVGSLILYRELPELSGQALERCNEWGQKYVEAEQSVLGFDHTQVGGALLKLWDLPEIFCETTAYHHNPLEAPNYPKEAAIVHLANYIALNNQLGSSGPHHAILDPELLNFLELSPEVFSSISNNVIQHFHETTQEFAH